VASTGAFQKVTKRVQLGFAAARKGSDLFRRVAESKKKKEKKNESLGSLPSNREGKEKGGITSNLL